jgi:tetrahydromethanopterin S-methyltransferase subunit F
MNQYLNYSDELLMEVYTDMMDFSGKASDEMLEAINARGGLENWLKQIEQNSIKPNEIKRITKEVYALSGKATNVEFLKTLIRSDILSKQELHELIEDKFARSQAITKDRSITSKTIIGSIAGIVVGSLICGSLLSFVIIYLIQLYFILIIPVYIICYFIIKLITRQSRRNPVVFIAAFIATVLSFIITF